MRGTTVQVMALAFAIPCGVLDAPSAFAQASEAERALQGIWVLNAELSDDPRATFRDGGAGDRGRRGPSPGGGRGGFGGGRGGFGGGGDRPSPEEMAERRAAMQSAIQDLMTAARRMTIVEGEQEVRLTYDDGRVVRLIPDDEEHAGIAGDSMQVKRRTRWDGERLVVQIELEGRMTLEIEQVYEVNADGEQMAVTSTIEGGPRSDEPRVLRRVYDRDSD